MSGDWGKRGGLWVAIVLALPVVGLIVLLAQPEIDLLWEHHPSHFWLVLGTAVLSVTLAFVTNEAATRRGDARLMLISLAFLASAGFLGLHALATPGVLLPGSNAGFVVATPVGLALASIFAVISISPLAGPRGDDLLRRRNLLRRGLVVLMVGWGIVSLAGLPPLSGPLPPAEAAGPVAILAAASVAMLLISAWRYWRLYSTRGTVLPLAIACALVLLAEAMLAVAFSRNWHLSWWEWHMLMAIAFLSIALGARAEYQRTRSLSAAFGGIYLEATLARLDRWHARAIADLARLQEGDEPADALLTELRRDGASEEDLRILQDAAGEVRRVADLFRPYLPAALAERLRTEPQLGDLGGEEREVTVLFADLAGFTRFSETHRPSEVLHMLNAFWAPVVPIIEHAGGLIEHFAGDGMMVIFNALAEQPDHALRAAGSALRITAETGSLADANTGWPRFRIGVNSGAAVVGNVGAAGRQTFGAIGDTANLGARLMSAGRAGEVVIGRSTVDALARAGAVIETTALGMVRVKGKREPVEAWVLYSLSAPANA